MKLKENKFSFLQGSRVCIVLVAAFWISIIFAYKPWQKNQIINDVVSYYGYLPALFIEKDITLKFTEGMSWEPPIKYWPETAPNGGKVIKTTMGLSVLYAPFFLIAHFVAPLFHQPRDGFSAPYQFCLLLSCLAFLILGMVFLKRLLLLYFSEKVTGLTIISVFFASNLVCYSTVNGLMAHGYLFCLTTIFIYKIVKWHQNPSPKTALMIGLLGGLITLIRPIMVLAFLIFFLFDIYDKPSFRKKTDLLKNNYRSLIIIALSFFILIFPQLIYWKYITGNWLFYSYTGERFYFNHPHILEGLFGFRKGWLIYTPVMCFALLGIFRLKRFLPSFFLPIIVLVPILIYVFFSWWAWWFGGSFGLRAFVDYYGFFALPMACFYKEIIEGVNRFLKNLTVTAMVFFICLNLFQSWQYYKGYLHYDSMTMKAYFAGFFDTRYTLERFSALEEPEYGRARLGLPEEYTEEEIMEIKPDDIIRFKGYNNFFIFCEEEMTKELYSGIPKVEKWEQFSLIKTASGKYVLKTSENEFITIKSGPKGALIGNTNAAGNGESFELIYWGNSIIELRAGNNKYVTVSNNGSVGLTESAEDIVKEARLRILIN
jgi:hypothetical protein